MTAQGCAAADLQGQVPQQASQLSGQCRTAGQQGSRRQTLARGSTGAQTRLTQALAGHLQSAPENMVCWQPLLALDCVVSHAAAALHPVVQNDLHTRSKAASMLTSLLAASCAGQAGASIGAACDEAMQGKDMQAVDGDCLKGVQGKQLWMLRVTGLVQDVREPAHLDAIAGEETEGFLPIGLALGGQQVGARMYQSNLLVWVSCDDLCCNLHTLQHRVRLHLGLIVRACCAASACAKQWQAKSEAASAGLLKPLITHSTESQAWSGPAGPTRRLAVGRPGSAGLLILPKHLSIAAYRQNATAGLLGCIQHVKPTCGTAPNHQNGPGSFHFLTGCLQGDGTSRAASQAHFNITKALSCRAVSPNTAGGHRQAV